MFVKIGFLACFLLLACTLEATAGGKKRQVVRHERVEFTYYNKEYISYCHSNTTRYNRTTVAFNTQVKLKITLEHDFIITGKLYRNINNQPKATGIGYSANICDALENNSYGMQVLVKNGNLTKCPIKAGYYEINNVIVPEDNWPPFPQGQYILTSNLTYNNIVLITAKYVGSVLEVIDY